MRQRLVKRIGKYKSFRRLDLPKFERVKSRRRLSTAELFVGSFLMLVVLGSCGLKFLPGLCQSESLSWHDAVFTATSAVCVTGLIVVDTATYFTFAGQAFILLLIQLGGLGILVLSSVIFSTLGRRPSLRTERVAANSQSIIPHVPARQMILDIVKFTFIIEALGALLLYIVWVPQKGWGEAVWPAIFHSISAFCNAGFSTNTLSLIECQHSPATIMIISFLIIAGGLGFIPMEELYLRFRSNPKQRRRLSVHSKLVIVTSVYLLLGGWVLFLFFEWNGVFDKMLIVDKFSNAFFLSVTPRTAGFNSIDYAQASDSTNFLTIILMMIGGSPGSTAGGIKTTTFVLLGLLAWSRFRSQPTVTFANRSIPAETIQRATGLFVIATGIVVIGVLLLSSIGDFMNKDHTFLERLFEVVSALNTVGLSMGITAELTAPGKWLMVVLMFIGRTGPLSIAAALIIGASATSRYRLAFEDVIVG